MTHGFSAKMVAYKWAKLVKHHIEDTQMEWNVKQVHNRYIHHINILYKSLKALRMYLALKHKTQHYNYNL